MSLWSSEFQIQSVQMGFVADQHLEQWAAEPVQKQEHQPRFQSRPGAEVANGQKFVDEVEFQDPEKPVAV
jgi:hypothetical protein